MRSKRSIRLFFVFAALLVIVIFLTGYVCGRYYTAYNLSKQTRSFEDAKSDNSKLASEDAGNENAGDRADTTVSYEANGAETGQKPSQTKDGKEICFYLKDTGEYLAAYDAVTGKLYFETDLRAENLPEDLQRLATENGIPFYDLEELYHFLENYPS